MTKYELDKKDIWVACQLEAMSYQELLEYACWDDLMDDDEIDYDELILRVEELLYENYPENKEP
jgi:hypothetical protein